MRLCDGKPGTYSRSCRFFDQINLRRFGPICGVFDGSAFYLGNLAGNAYDNAWAHPASSVVRLPNEVLKHLLGYFEIGDHSVFHWPDGNNVARRATKHLLGVDTNGFDLICRLIYSKDGGFTDNDAAPFGVNQRVRRSEINSQIVGAKAGKQRKRHRGYLKRLNCLLLVLRREKIRKELTVFVLLQRPILFKILQRSESR